jgi:hypothetical protein
VTELARTQGSQQQSQKEDDDVVYKLWYICLQVHCKSCIYKSHGKDPFGSKRHSEGLFWKDWVARGNHWSRVLQNWRSHAMIMTWRNCVWDQVNLKLIRVIKEEESSVSSLLLSLPQDLQSMIYAKLPLQDLYKLQTCCKELYDVIHHDSFKLKFSFKV